MSKKKIGFVIHRFGNDIIGGAEAHAYKIVKHMSKYWDIDIITTKARDYVTWEDSYIENQSYDKDLGANILRFSVDKNRDMKSFSHLSAMFENKIRYDYKIDESEVIEWMKEQGPYSSSLIKYISEKSNEYEGIVFFTYLYATTYFGIIECKCKKILVPTAHDEWTIYLPIWNKWFQLVDYFVFNTDAEKNFLISQFPAIKTQKGEIVALGFDLKIDEKQIIKILETDVRKYGNYILYVGRIDLGKSCDELFKYFIEYKKNNENSLKLLLIGKDIIEVPKHKDIVFFGIKQDEEKYAFIKGAFALVNPSKFESLSMVLIESWQMNTPTIVSSDCDVMVSQTKKSNGGFVYKNINEFEAILNVLLEEKWKPDFTTTNNFVCSNYSWDVVEKKYLNIFD